MTFSQLWDYADALDDHRRRELRERAVAARAAQATQEGWEQFLEALERPAQKDAQADAAALEALVKEPPRSNVSEDGIEWLQKSKSE